LGIAISIYPCPHLSFFSVTFSTRKSKVLVNQERERKLATSNLLHAATVGIQQKKCYYISVKTDISPDDMSHGKYSQTPIFLQL
jgi:hypothetical protein